MVMSLEANRPTVRCNAAETWKHSFCTKVLGSSPIKMNVRELIEALQKHDPEMSVIFLNIGAGWADGNCQITEVIEQDAVTFDNKPCRVVMLESKEGF